MVAGVLLFVVGIAIGSATIESNWRAADRRPGWQKADGTVVDIVRGQPLVAYQLPSGERVSFTAASAEGGGYSITDRVHVIYNPARPEEAAIDPRSARWTRNAVAGGASIVLIALGAYVAWYARRWDARHRQG